MSDRAVSAVRPARRQLVLQYVEWRCDLGFPPTLREIAHATAMSSTWAREHLRALCHEGALQWFGHRDFGSADDRYRFRPTIPA
jgi:hypothetical protein